MEELNCTICHQSWKSRKSNPLTCPKCRSLRWKKTNNIIKKHEFDFKDLKIFEIILKEKPSNQIMIEKSELHIQKIYQNEISFKTRKLINAGLIKRERKYFIDYEGIIQYIFTNICDLPLNKPVMYDDLIIIIKDYLKEISQLDLSQYSINDILKGFLIGHDLRRNQELIQMETRIPLIGLLKAVDYEPEPSREGLTPIKDIHDAHERNKANIHFYRCSSKFVHEIPHIQNKLSNISKKIWDKYNIIA